MLPRLPKQQHRKSTPDAIFIYTISGYSWFSARLSATRQRRGLWMGGSRTGSAHLPQCADPWTVRNDGIQTFIPGRFLGHSPATLNIVKWLSYRRETALQGELAQIFLPFCHNARVWQTDRRTDRRTDRQTEFSSQDRVCIPCSAVKTIDIHLRLSLF